MSNKAFHDWLATRTVTYTDELQAAFEAGEAQAASEVWDEAIAIVKDNFPLSDVEDLDQLVVALEAARDAQRRGDGNAK